MKERKGKERNWASRQVIWLVCEFDVPFSVASSHSFPTKVEPETDRILCGLFCYHMMAECYTKVFLFLRNILLKIILCLKSSVYVQMECKI